MDKEIRCDRCGTFGVELVENLLELWGSSSESVHLCEQCCLDIQDNPDAMAELRTKLFGSEHKGIDPDDSLDHFIEGMGWNDTIVDGDKETPHNVVPFDPDQRGLKKRKNNIVDLANYRKKKPPTR